MWTPLEESFRAWAAPKWERTRGEGAKRFLGPEGFARCCKGAVVLTQCLQGQEQHWEPDRTCPREVGAGGTLSEHTCPGCRAPLVLSCRSHCENKGGEILVV